MGHYPLLLTRTWNNVRCRDGPNDDDYYDHGGGGGGGRDRGGAAAFSAAAASRQSRRRRRHRHIRRHRPRRRNRMLAIEIYGPTCTATTKTSSFSPPPVPTDTTARGGGGGGRLLKHALPARRSVVDFQQERQLNDQDMVYLTIYKKTKKKNKRRVRQFLRRRRKNRRRWVGLLPSAPSTNQKQQVKERMVESEKKKEKKQKQTTASSTSTNIAETTWVWRRLAPKLRINKRKLRDDGDVEEKEGHSRSGGDGGGGGGDNDAQQDKKIDEDGGDDISISSSSSASSSSLASSSSSSSSSDSDSDSFSGDDEEGGSSNILGGAAKNVRSTAAATVVNSTDKMRDIVRGVLDTTLNTGSSHHRHRDRGDDDDNCPGGGGAGAELINRNGGGRKSRASDKVTDDDDGDDEEDEDDWIESYRIRLEEVDAFERKKKKTDPSSPQNRPRRGGGGGGSRVWVASFGIGRAQHRRKFVFETESQSHDFHQQFIELKRLIEKRSEQRLEDFKQRRSDTLASKIQNENDNTNISSSITSVLPSPLSSLLVGGTSTSLPSIVSQTTQSQRNRTRIIRSFNNETEEQTRGEKETAATAAAASVASSSGTTVSPETGTGASNSSNVTQKGYGSIIGTYGVDSDKGIPNATAVSPAKSVTANGGDVKLLVEIVSASDLPVADQSSTDPYVVVYLGHRLIHKTTPIKDDLNPVWTVDTLSLFLISCTAKDFFSHDAGLTFHIIDQDHVTKDDVVASVSIPQTKLLVMDGVRESFKLDVSPRIKIKKKNIGRYYKPKLHLRVRHADNDDVSFMKLLTTYGGSKSEGVNVDQSFTAPTKERVGVLRRESKYVNGVKLHRVKPRPDPERDEQDTKWMSKEMIEKETMKPSHSWVEAGTGSLGRMFVEVLKCDDLPNMDLKIPGRPQKGLTDAFSCLIFEDSIVTTDVIRDDLNPRWIPWSQRAFLFNITHPSSQLHIGVFDYDLGMRGIRCHDPIGRISVDITNFRPGTEYVLSYNLFESILNNEREPNGTITIRLMFEYDSFRQYALAGVKGAPHINHVNVARKDDFKMAHFVCNGEEDLNQFNLKDLLAYQTELESLVVVIYYIRKSFMTVIFWRGHKPINLFGSKKPLLVPLHSVVAFVLGVTLVENFNLLPSYSFFCVAWFLMATNDDRQKNPSPWHGSMTVMQMWYALIFDIASPENISDYENEAAIKRYEKERRRRHDYEEMRARTRREAVQQIAELMYGEMTTPLAPNDTDTISKVEELGSRLRTVPTINPLARALIPVQKVLRRICRAIRVVKSIILWDESYIAFSIVNVSIFVGVATVWVPWGLILRWICRISAWVLLGPWMKLVDVYILPKMVGGVGRGGDEDKKDEALRQFAVSQIEELMEARETFLKKKEEVMKRRAMRRYMFGRYATKVPRFKEFRYRDVPLPQSYASPIRYDDLDSDESKDETSRRVLVSKRTHGQTLVGDMVPTWGDAINE